MKVKFDFSSGSKQANTSQLTLSRISILYICTAVTKKWIKSNKNKFRCPNEVLRNYKKKVQIKIQSDKSFYLQQITLFKCFVTDN